MAVSKGDYNESQVTAARAVMVELGHLLGEFREDVVIIGGWVPALLFEQSRDPHIGSIDVDLALDHRSLRDPAYETIRRLLTRRGYREGKQPFMFSRTVRLEDRDIEVDAISLSGYSVRSLSRESYPMGAGTLRLSGWLVSSPLS